MFNTRLNHKHEIHTKEIFDEKIYMYLHCFSEVVPLSPKLICDYLIIFKLPIKTCVHLTLRRFYTTR